MWMLENAFVEKSTLVQVMVRQQAIFWANVGPDLHHQIASLSRYELKVVSITAFNNSSYNDTVDSLYLSNRDIDLG